MSAPPVSKNIRPSHDGQKPADTPASLNNYRSITAENTPPANCLQGSVAQIVFPFKKPLGKVIDSVLRIDLSIKCASGDAGGYLSLAPTTYWFDRREDMYGANVLESQDADQIHLSTLAFLTDQEYSTLAEAVNIGADGNFKVDDLIHVTTSATKKTFWLPVWSGLFHSAQPFVRGFKDEWKLRFTTAVQGIVNSYKTTEVSTGGTNADASDLQISVAGMTLYATEAELSASAQLNLERAHKRQIVYRCIAQSKFSANEGSIGSSSEYQKTLTSLSAPTAGLAVFVKPSSSDVADCLTKHPVAEIGLVDGSKKEIVQRLPEGLVRYFIQPESVPLTSHITDSNVQSYYIFPFCANLLDVLETGQTNGGLQMTGNEMVVFRPEADLDDPVTVVVVAYQYAHIVVSDGVPTLRKTTF
jgi:hypothetical protein